MVSWIIPIVRQSKTDLIHRKEMRPLRRGGSHFVNLQNLQNGCLHDVRDASLFCESSQFLTAWRLVLSMKPWSYIWLEFGLFSTIITIIRACACWALFVVTLTNTVHLIYIYIYIYISHQLWEYLQAVSILLRPRCVHMQSVQPNFRSLIECERTGSTGVYICHILCINCRVFAMVWRLKVVNGKRCGPALPNQSSLVRYLIYLKHC